MDSRHLVDPELLPALDALPLAELGPDTLPLIRAAMAEMAANADLPEGLPVTVEARSIPGPPGAPPVDVMVYLPTAATAPLPAYLHIHGGGYVLGSPRMGEARHRALCAELGCAIVSVAYRLAPETCYPGPVEDCYAALAWLHGAAAELGIDPARIGVGGESAGGGLAAGLALLARDRGDFPLAFQHLIYPMIDDRVCVEQDPHPYTGEFIWPREKNRFGWTALLGHEPGGDGVSPYAAAARAADLAGLPATFIAVGALDLFLDENLEYARRLARAGVPLELHVYPGAFHGFGLAPAARVSIAAERIAVEALRRAMHG